MSLNWEKLVSQGRAKAQGVAWSPEELEALLTLERERSLSRLTAADYIRNGIMTLDAYDASQEEDFIPKTIEEAKDAVDATLKAAGAKFSGTGKRKKK